MSVEIVVLDAAAAQAAMHELADVLADCVAGGASVSFMLAVQPRRRGEVFRKGDRVDRGAAKRC